LGGRRRRGGNNSFAGTILLEDSHRGTIVAGNFGLGGQETVRIPGARESERLFLVGWEVNTQFGQVQHHQQHHQLQVEHQVEVNTLCIFLLLLSLY
jgi:hypothetical protein